MVDPQDVTREFYSTEPMCCQVRGCGESNASVKQCLHTHPQASDHQAAGQAETQSLEEADEVEAVITIPGHSFRAGKYHGTRLDGAEEEPVQHKQIEEVEGDYGQHAEDQVGAKRNWAVRAIEGGQTQDWDGQHGQEDRRAKIRAKTPGPGRH